jgi:hypothetical protein
VFRSSARILASNPSLTGPFEKNLIARLATPSVPNLTSQFFDNWNLWLVQQEGASTTKRLTPCKAEDENLGVTWLPPVKIDVKSPNFFPMGITSRIDEPKKLLRFPLGKEWRVHKFGHPIHFVRVRQVECDLSVFIGILYDDQAVVVAVRVLPFAFEENRASFLHLGGTQASLFEERNHIRIRQRFHGRAFWLALCGFNGNCTAGEGDRG